MCRWEAGEREKEMEDGLPIIHHAFFGHTFAEKRSPDQTTNIRIF